jgi:hypothetical protein
MIAIALRLCAGAVSIARGLWASGLGRTLLGVAAVVCVFVVYGHNQWAAGHKKGLAEAETRIVTRIEKVTGAETVRREEVLKTVQVRTRADIAKIDQLQTRLAALQETSANASHALDSSACLPADSVLRLAAVR